MKLFANIIMGILMLSAAIPALAQSAEDVILNDIRSLGYDVDKNDGYYNMTKSGSMYERPSRPYMLTFMKNGRHTLVNIFALVSTYEHRDTSFISAMYDAMIAGLEVHCAGYVLARTDDRHIMFLKRTIEGDCYSKSIVKQVVECIDEELSTWSGFNSSSNYYEKSKVSESTVINSEILKNILEVNRKGSK